VPRFFPPELTGPKSAEDPEIPNQDPNAEPPRPFAPPPPPCYAAPMRALPFHRLFGLVLTLLLLVASATGGLAHRAPLNPDDVALQAHAQVWGLADPALCADAGDSELAGPTRCDACRLVGAALVPDLARPLLLCGRVLPLAWALPEPLRTAFAARPAHPARAPPRG